MDPATPDSARRLRRLRHAPSALLYLALALEVTFPLWIHPGGRVQSLGDPLLNSYILAWDRYALFHQLYEFFQANVFWPHADALAYGEHLLAPAILALPVSLASRAAPALHNLSLVEAYFFCALAAHALGFFYFRSVAAATAAGLAYGFAAYRISQIGHVQLVHGEFLPLMVLGFERALRSEEGRWKWVLGAAALGQWLTSWYWAVFSFWCVGPYFAVRLWQFRRMLPWRRLAGVVAPLMVAAACVLPVAIPYMRLKSRNLLFRPKEASAGLSARPADFLSPPERTFVHGWLRDAEGLRSSERNLFPGVAAALGVAASLALAFRTKLSRNETDQNFPSEPRAFSPPLWFAITLLMLVFSFGGDARLENGRSYLLPYALVERFFPFAESLRVPARWMLPALLGVSMFVGYSLDRLLGAARAGLRAPLAAGALALLVAEGLTRPAPTVEVETSPPPVYAWLDRQSYPAPTLELPVLADDDNRAMLHATWHRQPIVNGSNGYFPPGHARLLRTLAGFPDAESLAKLRESRVRFVLIDGATTAEKPKLSTPSELQAALAGLGAKAEVLTFGRHVVVDLGAAEEVRIVAPGLTP